MTDSEITNDARVFVTQENGLDFADAERYGTITFLTRADLNNTRGSLHNEEVLRFIRAGLRDFEAKRDWLVIVGSPYVSAAVFLLLGHMRVQSLRLLRWSNKNRVYQPLYLELRREDIEP